MLVRAGLSIDYSDVVYFVKRGPEGGFAGLELHSFVDTHGMDGLTKLRSPFMDFFGDENRKAALQAALATIRQKQGKEQPSGGSKASGRRQAVARSPPPSAAERDEATDPDEEESDTDVNAVEAAVHVASQELDASLFVTPQAPRRPAASRTPPTESPPSRLLRSAAKRTEDQKEADAAKLVDALLAQLASQAAALQSHLIDQCRRLPGSCAALREAVEGAAGSPPAARFRIEFDCTSDAADSTMPESLAQFFLPDKLRSLGGRSAALGQLVAEHDRELSSFKEAWCAPSRLMGLSVMRVGVRIWAAAFEVSRGAASIAYIDSRGLLVKDCVGGDKVARKLLQQAFLLASLAWLRASCGVERVFFASFAPVYETGSTQEWPMLGLGSSKSVKLAVRRAYLLGYSRHSLAFQMRPCDPNLKKLADGLHAANQTALRAFYDRVCSSGRATATLSAASGELRPDGAEDGVPYFGVDSCFLLPVREALTLEKDAVLKVMSRPANAADPENAFARRHSSMRLKYLGTMQAECRRQWCLTVEKTPDAELAAAVAIAASQQKQPPDVLRDEAHSAARFSVDAEEARREWDGKRADSGWLPVLPSCEVMEALSLALIHRTA